MEDIPNKVINYMGLVVDVNLYEQEGLECIEIVIDHSNVAISYKGKYYYRSGSTMQELNGVALQQFLLKKMGRSWDDITNEHATLDDIDRKAIAGVHRGEFGLRQNTVGDDAVILFRQGDGAVAECGTLAGKTGMFGHIG